MPAGADFREKTAVGGQADAQHLIGALRVKGLLETALVGHFLAAPRSFPDESIVSFHAFGQQVEFPQPVLELKLAFFMRPIEPTMQCGQIEWRCPAGNGRALPEGGQQFMVA